MKKVILVILILAFCAGIGIVGYMVFSKKNIDSVELEGEVQSLYLVNETTLPNFQDASLKITYKNGNISYVSLDKATYTVSDFSTSIEDTRNMKINYKSNIIEVPYTVIKSGLYYVSSTQTVSAGDSGVSVLPATNYSIANTREMFYISLDGSLKYYQKGTDSNWYLYDGNYLSDYTYNISGDSLNIYLGSKDPTYSLSVDTTTGDVVITSQNTLVESGLEVSKTTRSYKFYEMKTNATIHSHSVVCDLVKAEEGKDDYFEFFINETIADRYEDILLKVTYTTPLITYTENGVNYNILETVYVVASDSMVKNNGLVTKDLTNYNKTVTLWYEGAEFVLNYRVHLKVQ